MASEVRGPDQILEFVVAVAGGKVRVLVGGAVAGRVIVTAYDQAWVAYWPRRNPRERWLAGELASWFFGRSLDYVAGKLGANVFDAAESERRARQFVLEARRCGSLDADEAREAYDAINFFDRGDVQLWLNDVPKGEEAPCLEALAPHRMLASAWPKLQAAHALRQSGNVANSSAENRDAVFAPTFEEAKIALRIARGYASHAPGVFRSAWRAAYVMLETGLRLPELAQLTDAQAQAGVYEVQSKGGDVVRGSLEGMARDLAQAQFFDDEDGFDPHVCVSGWRVLRSQADLGRYDLATFGRVGRRRLRRGDHG